MKEVEKGLLQMPSYWDKFFRQRISRRQSLTITGSFSASLAFLAACGGDDASDGGGGNGPAGGGGTGGTGGQAATGLIHEPIDTTESAKRGGIYKTTARFEPNNFDLYDFDATLQPFSNVAGSQLLMIKPGRMEAPSLEVTGDLAESWELSPDRLALTIKLNPRAKWSPLSPNFHQGVPQSVAGRQIDADDVTFSWERFKSTATAFGNRDLVNEIAPSAPVSSLTKVDQSTIRMEMVRPYAPLYGVLARPNVGYFYILPKEGQDGLSTSSRPRLAPGHSTSTATNRPWR